MNDFVFKGKVVYQSLGTGFWGIEGDNGEQWRPSNLPKEFHKNGVRVKGKAKPSAQQVSIFMWGKNVDILHVEMD